MPGCPLRRTCTRPLEGALRSKAEGELTLGLMSGEKRKRTRTPCGSEPAREKRVDTAVIQTALVIVDAHRRQAGLAPTGECIHQKSQVGWQADSRCCGGIRPLERPSGGSAQWATRHGCRVSRARPGMAVTAETDMYPDQNQANTKGPPTYSEHAPPAPNS